MATGFMAAALRARGAGRWDRRHYIAASVFSAFAAAAGATQVGLAGLIGNAKAVLLVNGVSTRTVAVGQRTPEGVRLLSIEAGVVTVEIDGSKQSLRLGQNANGASSGPQTAVLTADSRGQYLAHGSINGLPVRFVIDTGASMVSLGANEAKRLGIAGGSGERSFVQTANGVISAQRVRLDKVAIGGITLDAVDALIQESDMPVALLGMSFLGRTDIQNENGQLTLKKRY